jgi:hypothetical protein
MNEPFSCIDHRRSIVQLKPVVIYRRLILSDVKKVLQKTCVWFYFKVERRQSIGETKRRATGL